MVFRNFTPNSSPDILHLLSSISHKCRIDYEITFQERCSVQPLMELLRRNWFYCQGQPGLISRAKRWSVPYLSVICELGITNMFNKWILTGHSKFAMFFPFFLYLNLPQSFCPLRQSEWFRRAKVYVEEDPERLTEEFFQAIFSAKSNSSKLGPGWWGHFPVFSLHGSLTNRMATLLR